MPFQFSPYVLLHGLTASVSVLVILISLKRRSTHPSKPAFIKMMGAIAAYGIVAGLEAGSVLFSHKIFWSALEYLGSGITLIYFLLFAIHLSLGHQEIELWKRLIIWGIPLGNFILAATNSWHHLIWTGFLEHPQQSNVLIYQHGWGFIWAFICAYIYVFIAIFYLAKATINASLIYRRNAIFALLGALFPLVTGTAYLLKLTPLGLNITPMSFLLTGISYLVGLLLYQIFDLIPVARDTLIENLADGVIVLDLKKRIIDLNPAILDLLSLTKNCIGKSAIAILDEWQDIVVLSPKNEISQIQYTREQYIEVRMMPLRDRMTKITGYLLVFRNITRTYEAEEKLRKVNRRLKSQLRKISLLQTQLQEQAIRDALTGIYNRRFFEESIKEQLQQAQDRQQSLAIFLIDVDYFKKVNDNYGHQAGDLVLKTLGTILLDCSDKFDLPCRYGGEEFAIAWPQVSLTEAYQKAENIRSIFAHTTITYGDRLVATTLSGGLGFFPQDGITRDTLLSNIDRALYAAKAAGRNQIKLVSEVITNHDFASH
ncbi:MAG: diguanylate cyclase [Spirulinaceae cyanobacterium]